MRIVLSLLFVTLVAAIGYGTSTPEFAIFEARYAINEKSLDRFEHAVDIDSVAKNLVQDSISAPISKLLGSGNIAHWVVDNLNDLFKSDLEQAAKNEIRESVKSGTLLVEEGTPGAAPNDDKTLASRSKELGFSDYHYWNMLYSLRETAPTHSQVTLDFRNEKTKKDLLVKVELTRAEGDWFWKVSRVTNIQEIIGALVQDKTQNLKDSADDLGKKIKDLKPLKPAAPQSPDK